MRGRAVLTLLAFVAILFAQLCTCEDQQSRLRSKIVRNDAPTDSKIISSMQSLTNGMQDSIRVACIGDSITVGEGSGNNELESYPAKLQRLLDSGSGSSSGSASKSRYIVKKFAVSGATVLRNQKLSIWDRPELQQAIDFKPDIVVSMFGTNDAKLAPFDQLGFMTAYADLIKTFIAAASTDSRSRPMQFLVATPPPIVVSDSNTANNLQNSQIHILRRDTVQKFPSLMAELVAGLDASQGPQGERMHSFRVVRTFEGLEANLKSAMFPEEGGGLAAAKSSGRAISPENEMSLKRCGDGVHPCRAGYQHIASIVYRSVLEAQSQARVQAQARARVQAQARAQSQAQARAQVPSQVQPQIQPQTQDIAVTANIKPSTETEAKTTVDEDIPDTFYQAISVKGDLITKALVLWTWMWANPARAVFILFMLVVCSQVPWMAWACQIAIMCCIREGARSEAEPAVTFGVTADGRLEDNMVVSPAGSIALKRMNVAASVGPTATSSDLKDV